MEEERTYGFGELVADLREATLDHHYREHGAGRTRQAFSERAVKEVEVNIRDTRFGVLWVTVTVLGKRAAYSHHDTYRVLERSRGVYALDSRCLA